MEVGKDCLQKSLAVFGGCLFLTKNYTMFKKSDTKKLKKDMETKNFLVIKTDGTFFEHTFTDYFVNVVKNLYMEKIGIKSITEIKTEETMSALLQQTFADINPALNRLDFGDAVGDSHDVAKLFSAIAERNEISDATQCYFCCEEVPTHKDECPQRTAMLIYPSTKPTIEFDRGAL